MYHSDGSAEQGISFTNVGWTGWIGSITGLSAAEVGICEIGVSYPDATFGPALLFRSSQCFDMYFQARSPVSGCPSRWGSAPIGSFVFHIPCQFLLRDILQFDKTREDAQQHITNANRTCDLILGVGDGKVRPLDSWRRRMTLFQTNSFRGVEYSHSVANFYSDTNMKPEATWHPRINNTVYYGTVVFQATGI